MSFELTERAAKEVRAVLKQQELPEATCLRVGIRGIGCGGFNYLLDLVDAHGPEDQVSDSHGVRLVCDAASAPQFEGTVIDFRDDEVGRGFVFDNPNAPKCSCDSKSCG